MAKRIDILENAMSTHRVSQSSTTLSATNNQEHSFKGKDQCSSSSSTISAPELENLPKSIHVKRNKL
ncbi:unnamed protein product [Acanthoscelides obtectus]|uniref:Uncharacterized protein n=1 Tax=Acanthoscelides obtectus TaxID=200917 RepID=A0A9P0Q082_ACAOB|nr:unnamed protein product [Acanthoscelides obtectus]CAK1671560.1 hypothetical protein AOBTE_LOCUS28317 [Acanthoscelides obtectus]